MDFNRFFFFITANITWFNKSFLKSLLQLLLNIGYSPRSKSIYVENGQM